MLPVRVEDWTEMHTRAVMEVILRLAPYPVVGAWVVGSYCFGRTDDHPPGDLDILLAVEGFDLAAHRAGVSQLRYRGALNAELIRLAGRDVEVFLTEPRLAEDDRFVTEEGIVIPRFDLMTGTLLGKRHGEVFPGTIDIRPLRHRWMPAKRAVPVFRAETGADIVRRRLAGQSRPNDAMQKR